MATYRVRREVITISEGIVIASDAEEASIKIMNGEWEYGRTEVSDDKVVSCDEVTVVDDPG